MPNPPIDRRATGAHIPRWKLWLMVPALPALAGFSAWWLHKAIVHSDPSAPGEIWAALALLLLFGLLTALLPLMFRVNGIARRPAGQRISPRIPQPVTVDIAKRSPILLLGTGIVFLAVSFLFSVAGFEGLGRRSAELFILGLLGTVFFAWFLPTYAVQRWKTRGVRWQIRIDAAGISDSRLGQFTISWGDVMSIKRWTVRGHPYIIFGLRNAAAYRKSLDPFGRRWARLSGALGSSSYKLGLYMLNIEESDLIGALRAFKPADVVMEGFPEAGLSARRA